MSDDHDRNISSTYLNSGGKRMGVKFYRCCCCFPLSMWIFRIVYVRSPEEESFIGILWELLTTVYGFVDSERLLYLTSSSALGEKYVLTKSKLEPTLYFSKIIDGDLNLLLIVQLDNYIYSGEETCMASLKASFLHHFR